MAIMTRGLLSEAAAAAMVIDTALASLGDQLQQSARFMISKGMINAQGQLQKATSPFIQALAQSSLGTSGVANLNYKVRVFPNFRFFRAHFSQFLHISQLRT